jgi:hypothetical protein
MDEPRAEFAWHPGWATDPIWMEYVLREVELESEVRRQLIATRFETVAKVHSAIAEGAGTMANVLRGVDK